MVASAVGGGDATGSGSFSGSGSGMMAIAGAVAAESFLVTMICSRVSASFYSGLFV